MATKDKDNTVKVGDPTMGNVFVPPDLTITAGTSVHWVNPAQGPQNPHPHAHTVTSNGYPGSNFPCTPSSTENFDSGEMDPGDPDTGTFDHTFNTTGIFGYHCEIHGCDMKGTIKVIETTVS
ncbi:MAG: plastocyanin/azurin family copper-binding protein [Candidatus Nitrosopolaris sp.]